jgi:hypothetical protein
MSDGQQTVDSPGQDSDSLQASSARWHRRPANKWSLIVSHVVLLAVGIFFIINGYKNWSQVQMVGGGKTATGTVIAVTPGQTCGRYGCSPNWTPTIRFVAVNGNTYSFVGPPGGLISDGNLVRVSYDPNNPRVAHDVSGSSNNGVFVMGMGVFAAVLGLGLFLFGLDAIHRRFGFESAHQQGWWVGNRYVHSNAAAVAAVAVLLALAVMGLLVY